MTKEKALELLKEAEERKTEILGNLKYVETFKVGKGIYYSSIAMLVLYILIITILYYTIYNPLYHFNSYFDFIISPVTYMYNFLFIAMVIFSLSIIFYSTIKIDFNKNCIKLKLFKKIYFDDILDMNIKEDGNFVYISIIDRDGKQTLIEYIPQNLGKFLLICKERLGHKFRTDDNIQYEKKKNKVLKIIFKIIISFIIYKILSICNNIIIKKYENGADFSKYGIVREEYFDIGYVESTYKHGRKNGIEKYYDKNGTLFREILYKNNEKLEIKEYENGIISGYDTYDENGKIVNAKFYYPDGMLERDVTYEGDIVKEKKYNEAGRIYEEGSSVGLLIYGKRVIYYPNGKIFMEADYDKGKIISPVKVYAPDGKLILQETYDKKNNIATYEVFGENGKRVKTFEKQTDNLVEYYSIKIRIFEYYRDSRRFKKEIEDLRQFL